MKKDFGITPPNDAKGCLQDIHWSSGLIGYFPTYALGNLYAAQFFEKAQKDLGDLDAMFARGEFAPLLDWLRKNIHHHGKRYTPRETGEARHRQRLESRAARATPHSQGERVVRRVNSPWHGLPAHERLYSSAFRPKVESNNRVSEANSKWFRLRDLLISVSRPNRD